MKVHFLNCDSQKDLAFDDQVQPYDSEGKQRFILCGQLNGLTEIFYGSPNPHTCRYSQVGSQS